MAIACLTFDFDAYSPWIIGGDVSPASLSRGEFGKIGAERLLGLLKDRGIATTWFIPGHTIETFPALCRRIHEAGHEIGHHGYMHEPPNSLDREREAAVLDRGIDSIRTLTGAAPQGYRSPSWNLSPNSVELLLERGLRYDSSLMGNDHRPYRCRVGDVVDPDGPYHFGQESALWEMPVSWSLDDFPHFEYLRQPYLQPGHMAASGVLDNWLDDFRYLSRENPGGLLIYTMHPAVIGRGHRMLMLERLIDGLNDMGASFRRLDQALDETTTGG